MTLYSALIALLLQTAPVTPAPAGKASVAGVVVNANGEPIPNIRVALGRTDMSLGIFGQMIAGGDRPPVEMTLSADTLSAIVEEMAAEVQGGGAPPELAAEAAAFKSVPVGDIYEIILPITGNMIVIPKSSPPVMTDDRGRFSISGVDPGTYKVIFSGNGYARQEYGQKTVSTGGVPMRLVPGQAKTDIAMRMSAVAAVSGRVRDSSGQPAVGVPVQLFQFSFDEAGQRKTQRVAATRSDDLGGYRMYYLSPGRYYLSAGNPPGQNPQAGLPQGMDALLLGGAYSTPNRVLQNYGMTYYPGVADENAASVIDIQSGADLRGLDLLVSPLQTYSVRGRVVDPRTGQPPQNATVMMSAQTRDILSVGGLFLNASYKPADGSFEMKGVGPGTYTITANIPNPPQGRPPDLGNMSPAERDEYFRSTEAAENARPKVSAPVRVVNSDVDNVILTLGNTSSISGRMRIEPSAQNVSLDFVRVQLKGAALSSPLDNGPQAQPVSPDGTFRINNVAQGDYRVSVFGLPEGFYVKEARVGESDVLNGGFRYSGPGAGTLDVVLSAGVGSVDGVSTDVAGQPMPGAQVVLIPTRNRERTELFRPVTSDLNGHFSIANVAPGDYTLIAWEAIEPFAFFDPNLIAQAEMNGKAVRVAESSRQTVNVAGIPLR